jgi:hypothetical protein
MRLELDQIIEATLVEQIDSQHWIVSYQGQLFQVTNRSGLDFEAQKSIQLQVVGLSPLRLATFFRRDLGGHRPFRRLT